MKKNLAFVVIALAATGVSAEVAVKPTALHTIGDAYELGIGAAHYLYGTTDPNGANCFATSNPGCAAGQTTIARAAYVGSDAGAGQDLLAVFAFDANQIAALNAKRYALRFTNAQNFTGQAYRIAVNVLHNRGEGDIGGRDFFENRGPFGGPPAGTLLTVMVEGRGERGDQHSGGRSIPGRAPDGQAQTPHDCGFPCVYLTWDRTFDVELQTPDHGKHRDFGIEEAIAAAQNTGSYTSCKTSCIGGAANADCDLRISNPLYLAVSALRGDGRSSVRIQDGMAVPNIIHLMGDCDFDGGAQPGDVSKVEFIWE